MTVELHEGPGAEFEEWEDAISRTFVPLRACRPAASVTGFRGDVTATSFGSVVLAEVRTASATDVERTPRLIRQTDPELYKFGLQLSGSCVLEQDDRQARLDPGDLAIYDTSRPYRIACSDGFAMIVAMFPRHLVHLPEQRMAELTAVRLCGDTGLGRLVAPLLRGLTSELDGDRTGITTHLGDAIVDLVTAALAERMALPSTAGARDPHRALVTQVRAYIDQHLPESTLCTQSIAEAHFVSARLLQKAFEAEGTSVSALIRSRRLERCRRDLVDPFLADVPLAVIGHRWGFPDAAHFSRLFRGVFGASPRAYRKAHVRLR
ncbi:helix-turn-helix domain-containing protein [Cryptosporangium aurantiacum]|uniref:Transcriptional regulator, AraC family n=1 Tax=Cryptosporangium aurantiacum TaxID=134849 RepID=A0A1M7RNL3_9ACTN|nr:helix-turn-helix domain-containing protein [Cryptosporangium aurantiacum]SHN47740.1 transcriptional regulator, AraC family [Cryptosporangium aurantiacum]